MRESSSSCALEERPCIDATGGWIGLIIVASLYGEWRDGVLSAGGAVERRKPARVDRQDVEACDAAGQTIPHPLHVGLAKSNGHTVGEVEFLREPVAEREEPGSGADEDLHVGERVVHRAVCGLGRCGLC